MSSRFERDTAVVPMADAAHRFGATLDPSWTIVRGPNGGYLAAILVRAMEAAVDEPTRPLRSLTVHYLRPPASGDAAIDVTIERSGRTLSTVTARMSQGDRLQLLATAAFAEAREGPSLHHATMPEVPPPEACPAREGPSPIPFHQHFEQRVAIGPTSFEAPRTREACTGGWIRLRDGHGLDPALAVLYADAWPPAVFASGELPGAQRGVPTVDLTVHLRAPLPAGVGPDDFVLVVFRTREVADGYLEEDGEIWSRDGRLLAHARQLGLYI